MIMGAKIDKICYYLPKGILTNQKLANEFVDFETDKIEKKIGIKERRIVGEDETASDLAFGAGELILKDFDRSKIDFVLFCTQSPDYVLPTSACVLQDRLNLPKSAGAIDYNLGCSGFVYGLYLSKAMVASGMARNVLLLVGETYSKHLHPKDKGNRSIFGDGAAAAIISFDTEDKIGEFVLGTDGSGHDKLIIRNGASKNQINESHSFEYGSGNVCSDNHIYMNGPEIFNFTIETIPGVVESTLEKHGYVKEDVDFYIFHQANKFMLDYLRKKIKISKDKFFNNMTHTGNTVSATIPIALCQATNEGLIKKGDKVMLVGFGVGLSWGATIITL